MRPLHLRIPGCVDAQGTEARSIPHAHVPLQAATEKHPRLAINIRPWCQNLNSAGVAQGHEGVLRPYVQCHRSQRLSRGHVPQAEGSVGGARGKPPLDDAHARRICAKALKRAQWSTCTSECLLEPPDVRRRASSESARDQTRAGIDVHRDHFRPPREPRRRVATGPAERGTEHASTSNQLKRRRVPQKSERDVDELAGDAVACKRPLHRQALPAPQERKGSDEAVGWLRGRRG
mmetsp:Transcript_15488/g.54283  ORF Transcript_15488/g.54283 Transcript_15488/m.54283 type:complete len:234 (+) Transcript_15488:600-1301(+)